MRDKLIEDNLGLVYYIVRKYYPTFINDEDIIQCGMVGLCQAAEYYDEKQGKFSTLASKCILNCVSNEFRSRMKHVDVRSLDYKIRTEDGKCTVADTIAGEEDVDYFDLGSFYDTLTDREKRIIDLRIEGYPQQEIGKTIHTSQETVSQTLKKLKRRWRKMYGCKD